MEYRLIHHQIENLFSQLIPQASFLEKLRSFFLNFTEFPMVWFQLLVFSQLEFEISLASFPKNLKSPLIVFA